MNCGLDEVGKSNSISALSPTRWKLKRAVKCLNVQLNGLKLEKHPDKTFIGRRRLCAGALSAETHQYDAGSDRTFRTPLTLLNGFRSG